VQPSPAQGDMAHGDGGDAWGDASVVVYVAMRGGAMHPSNPLPSPPFVTRSAVPTQSNFAGAHFPHVPPPSFSHRISFPHTIAACWPDIEPVRTQVDFEGCAQRLHRGCLQSDWMLGQCALSAGVTPLHNLSCGMCNAYCTESRTMHTALGAVRRVFVLFSTLPM
jgi:hypothetical protein